MLSWFVALGNSGLGQFMLASRWGFAVVEAVHLLGLSILGGAVLIVDCRLLGLVLKGESARNVSRGLSKLLLSSLVLMLATRGLSHPGGWERARPPNLRQDPWACWSTDRLYGGSARPGLHVPQSGIR